MIGNFKDIDPNLTIQQLTNKLGEADAYLYIAEQYKRVPKERILMAQDIIDEV